MCMNEWLQLTRDVVKKSIYILYMYVCMKCMCVCMFCIGMYVCNLCV